MTRTQAEKSRYLRCWRILTGEQRHVNVPAALIGELAVLAVETESALVRHLGADVVEACVHVADHGTVPDVEPAGRRGYRKVLRNVTEQRAAEENDDADR